MIAFISIVYCLKIAYFSKLNVIPINPITKSLILYFTTMNIGTYF